MPVLSSASQDQIVLTETDRTAEITSTGHLSVTGPGVDAIRSDFDSVLKLHGVVASAGGFGFRSSFSGAVEIFAGGSLSGGPAGLSVGARSLINNAGTIVGSVDGVVAGASFGRMTYIGNDGTIRGVNGIGVSTSGNLFLANEGTIQGVTYAVLAGAADSVTIVNGGTIKGAIQIGNDQARAVVHNTGRIEGYIGLGSSNDLYDGRGGTVTGEVFLGAGDDTAYGGAGTELFNGDFGNDWIDGGGGNDTIRYGEPRDYYTIRRNGDGTVTVTSGEGVDTLKNVRFAKFGDGQTEVLHNAAPTAVALSAASVAETAGVNSAVATLSSTDADGDAVTYSLVGSANGTFRLENNSLVLAKALDFETQARQHTVTVEASDKYGGRTVQAFTLAVANVVETHPLTLTGTAAVDALVGEAGADKFYGKGGPDVLTGGQGKDAFVFDTRPNSRTNKDTITDFSRADDTIHLAKNVFSKIAKKGVLEKKAFYVGTKAHDADDRIVYNKKTGALYYDADGNGAKAAVHFATLANKVSINERDFFVI